MTIFGAKTLTAVPRTVGVRLEIMKAIRALNLDDVLRKFDPNQPRVAAGTPEGGQWTSQSDDGGASTVFAARTPQTEAECELQFKQGSFICRSVRSSLCWAQAMERLGACLSGRQLPPLNF
jgi:hypothetical protein